MAASVQTLKDFHRNNFGLQILEGLSESFKSRQLCDVKIKCGNIIYYAHSIVLASVSQYFKEVFTSSETCKDLQFKCSQSRDFGSFLHLLYADFDYFTENFDLEDYERLLDVMRTLGVDSGYLEYLQLMGTNQSDLTSSTNSKTYKTKIITNQKSTLEKKSKSAEKGGAKGHEETIQGKRKRKKRVWTNMDGLELSQIVANMDEDTDADYEVDSQMNSDGIKLEVSDFDLSSTIPDDISILEKNAVGEPIFEKVGDLPTEELSKIKRKRRGIKIDDSIDELAIIPCNICGKMFKKRIHLNQHMLQMHIRPKKYPCKLCSQTFCNTGNLRRHFRVRHLNIRKFLCTLCGKSFTSKSSLDAHNITTSCKLEIADPMKNYLCKGCGTVIVGLINFRSHKYICGPFQNLRTLNNTKRSKKEKKIASCEHCKIDFSNIVSLDEHFDEKHPEFKDFPCTYCDSVFDKYSGLLMHHKNLHKKRYSKFEKSLEKKHECNECGFKFDAFCKLRIHMLIHTQEKPFTCNVCAKGFRLKKSLDIHMRIHYGDKPYSCKICDKSFRQKQHWKRHQDYHTGFKPYKCDRCESAYKQKPDLKHHYLRIHDMELPKEFKSLRRNYSITTGNNRLLQRYPPENTSPIRDIRMPVKFTTELTSPLTDSHNQVGVSKYIQELTSPIGESRGSQEFKKFVQEHSSQMGDSRNNQEFKKFVVEHTGSMNDSRNNQGIQKYMVEHSSAIELNRIPLGLPKYAHNHILEQHRDNQGTSKFVSEHSLIIPHGLVKYVPEHSISLEQSRVPHSIYNYANSMANLHLLN